MSRRILSPNAAWSMSYGSQFASTARQAEGTTRVSFSAGHPQVVVYTPQTSAASSAGTPSEWSSPSVQHFGSGSPGSARRGCISLMAYCPTAQDAFLDISAATDGVAQTALPGQQEQQLPGNRMGLRIRIRRNDVDQDVAAMVLSPSADPHSISPGSTMTSQVISMAMPQVMPVDVKSMPEPVTPPLSTGATLLSMEQLRERLVVFGKAQLVIGILMIFLTWSWVCSGLSIASAAVILTHLITSERAAAYFTTIAQSGGMQAARLSSCGCTPVHLRPLNLALGIVSAICCLCFIIAASTLGSMYISTAAIWDNETESYPGYAYNPRALASSLRFQAAMLVLGVLFSLATGVLAVGVFKTMDVYTDLAAIAFPYVQRQTVIYVSQGAVTTALPSNINVVPAAVVPKGVEALSLPPASSPLQDPSRLV